MSDLAHRKQIIKVERMAIHYPMITVVEDFCPTALEEYQRFGWRSHQINNTMHMLHPAARIGRA